MTEQMELFRERSPSSLGAKIDAMVAMLNRSRILHAADFDERFGWSDRTCRAIAEASEGRILSTNAGYVLTARATPDEFDQANSRIYSQGRKMMRRALRERRVRHQLIGAKA